MHAHRGLNAWLWMTCVPVVIENSVRAENAKISSACRHSLLEKLIEVTVPQRCNGVLNRKARSAENNSPCPVPPET